MKSVEKKIIVTIYRQAYKKMQKQIVGYQARDQVWDQVRYQAGDQVQDQVRDQVWDKTQEGII